MPIDALEIWAKLAGERRCREAVDYYSRKYSNRYTVNKRKKVILEQGAADFDQKYCSDDVYEKEHYRTDYYVSHEGYMDMHLKDSVAALQHCFEDGIPQPLLFVDFGCGPMTSGLALAEILSQQTPDYKKRTSYFGIDASRNMVSKANDINDEHNLFSSKRFKVVRDTLFDPQRVLAPASEYWTAVLCLSFVLAKRTWKCSTVPENAVKALADAWKKYIANQTQCREMIIIYINPVDYAHGSDLHCNWLDVFRPAMLDVNNAGGFSYTRSKFEPLYVESLRKEIALQIIRGTRK